MDKWSGVSTFVFLISLLGRWGDNGSEAYTTLASGMDMPCTWDTGAVVVKIAESEP